MLRLGPASESGPRSSASVLGARFVLVIGALLGALALLPDSPAPERSGHAATAGKSGTWVARVERPASARARPNPRARVVGTVSPIAPLAGGRQDLAVLSRTTRSGERWVRVRLAKRPNSSLGWLPADAVTLRRTVNRLEVDLSARQLTLFHRGWPAVRTSVAIGKAGTPTPTGEFAIAELIRTNRPGAFLGPVILPLTGFSQTLNEYEGGNGRVAIHGTSAPNLIGTAASNGCVRMNNADVLRIAQTVRPGDPVIIRA